MLHERFADTPVRTPLPHALHTPLPQSHSKHHSPSGQIDGLIYGTTIMVRKAMASIQKFLLEFQNTSMSDGELVSQQVYRIKMNDIQKDESSNVFQIEGKHIWEFDRQLYLQLIYHPAEMISCFDAVIKDMFERHFIQPQTNPQTRSYRQIRQANILMGLKGLHEDELICVKQLGPLHINRLAMLRAIVIRVSEVFPEMKRAWFRCDHCGDQLGIDMINARVQEPEQCRVCQRKQTMQIVHNLCTFTDKQYIKLQELPELIAEGETPSSLTAIAFDSNVDGFRPGDRVELIGIYRAQATKVDRHKGTLRTVFNTYLDLVSFSLMNENRYGIQKHADFTDSERLRFLKFAESPEVINNLVASFAPSIYGHDIVKKGILTQLFGGTKKIIPGRGYTRADINICLVGDPSTAKSQLLQQVHRIAPRSIYTSGRGTSAVGLTANVRRDPESRQFVLESGALVLADQGICCIDQFDKMDQNSRLILLQAMEQQTISIAKAGIVCQLNSRTAILAAANPILSKYDPKRSIIENINLPPALISRFDLLYIMLDLADQRADTRLATHILDFYVHGRPLNPCEGPLTLNQLTRYISYARQYVRPILTQAAGNKLTREYKSLRAKGMSKKTITATPRQLESLIRMSESFAKMRLSNQVSQQDVEEAINLLLKATLSTATDPETGIIDMDIITTGRSATMKKRIEEISHNLRQFLLANQTKYRKQTSLERLMSQFESFDNHKKMQVTREQFLEVIKVLQSNQLLMVYGQNKSNPNFKLQINTEE